MDYLIDDDQQQKTIRVISDVGPSHVGQGEDLITLWHQHSLGPVMMCILKTYGWHVEKKLAKREIVESCFVNTKRY